MEKEETQLDIISRLLPSGKLSETEKYIADQLIALEETEKFMLVAYPLTKEAKTQLLAESHPYIQNLLKKIEKKKRFQFESFADWYDLKAISYETVSQYLEGKVAHQILSYNLIKTKKITEEELKSLATKKRNLFKVLKNSGMPLDTGLPLEEKLEIYHLLDVVSKMNIHNMVSDYSTINTLEAMQTYGSAMFLVEWYYKHQDPEIDSYIEDVIKPEIEYRKENKVPKREYLVFEKTSTNISQ